ncbi:expressed unknown protein [Seminavis robusta]|uniref:Uncharacterized protein n=1 Tax=Seminavis robusta TaxID=568900 RepID=A0A9N8H385_9STRA|nr:expressed unknown protein [Seminavis robusta]|eukprot:Sro82_g044030.1 n/a (454) ;mRNA; f:95070-96431
MGGSKQVKQKQKKKKSPHDLVEPPKEPYHLRDDGFRTCQAFADGNIPPVGQPRVHLSRDVAPLEIPYQCAGPAYDKFGNDLQELIDMKAARTTSTSSSRLWGRRSTPIPTHAAIAASDTPPTFILFWGSTQLRQIVAALLCQYSEWVISVRHIYASRQPSTKSHAWQIILHPNIHMFVVINPPFVYLNDKWQDLLERHILNMPLAMMDMVVMSKFFRYAPKYGVALEEFWMDFEDDWTVPDTVNEEPIDLVDLLLPSDHTEGGIAYEGPILYVSWFAPYGTKEYNRVVEVIDALKEGRPLPADATRDNHKMAQLEHAYQKPQAEQHEGLTEEAEERLAHKVAPPRTTTKKTSTKKKKKKVGHGGQRRLEEEEEEQTTTLAKRTNLMAIDARKYVEVLGECATSTIENVGTCLTDTKHELYSKGPRCFGDKGGHADLVAWDIIEAIYSLIWRKH